MGYGGTILLPQPPHGGLAGMGENGTEVGPDWRGVGGAASQ